MLRAVVTAVWRVRPRQGAQLAFGSVLVAATCLPLAFFAMFAGFQGYDDEGYMLISLRHYAAGGALYDQVYSHYGPAFFEIMGAALPRSGLAFTHADGRTFTGGVWLATSVLCGVATYRLSRNVPVALCAQLLVFLTLEPLRNEPMHPGGLLCLLLGGVVLAGSWLAPRARPAVTAVIGALLAIAILTKINVGLFAVVSVVFALAAGEHSTRRWRAVQCLAAAAMLVVAPGLMLGHSHDPGVARYAAVVVLASLTVVVTELTRGPKTTGAGLNLAGLSIGLAVVGIVVGALQLVRGTSLLGLAHGVLLDPLQMPAQFSLPLRLPAAALQYAILSALACLLVTLVRRGWLPGRRRVATLSAAAPVAAGLLIWLATTRTASLEPFTVALPLLWVALAAPVKVGARDPQRAGKSLLLALAVLQTLHAYPVAGSQWSWATFLFIPVGAVGIADGWHAIAAAIHRRPAARAPAFSAALATLGVVALTALSGTMLYQRTARAKADHDAWVPLALPGTDRIRVPDATARRYQWLTARLSSRCKSFIGLPGFDSLYLFTGYDPPTMLTTNNWMATFDAPRQTRVRDAFARMPAPRCVIRNARRIDLWLGKRSKPAGPLVQFIEDSFVTVETDGEYELMLQRPQDPHRAGP